jgi:hypothetical protein
MTAEAWRSAVITSEAATKIRKGGVAMVKDEKSRISAKEATYVALDATKYPPVHISESDNSADGSDEAEVTRGLPTPVNDTPSRAWAS